VLITNRNAADPSVSVPVTLSDIERRDARVRFFRWISVRTLVTFDLSRRGNTRGKDVFLRGQPRHHPKGVGPGRPK